MTSGRSQLLGVVLCGGRSSRMGRDKAGLPHSGGKTFLQHAVDRLVPLCDDVRLSGGGSAQAAAARIADPVQHGGPIVGVIASLRQAAKENLEACVFTPVDTPNLSTSDLQSLILAWRSDRSRVVVTADDAQGQLSPLVGVYPVSVVESLQRHLDAGDRSLVRWLQAQDNVVTVTLPESRLLNVNRPEDLSPSQRTVENNDHGV